MPSTVSMIARPVVNIDALRGDGRVAQLWHRLLGGPASENGRLCRGDGSHEGDDRRRWGLTLTMLHAWRTCYIGRRRRVDLASFSVA